MYRELLAELSKGCGWVRPRPPCPEAEIAAAEKSLGCPFPPELRALLRELNGDKWLLLSASDIVRNAEQNRKAYLPLFKEDFTMEEYRDRIERFLFFAENGCGDLYGYRLSPEGVPDETTIFYWDHEEIGEPCCWKPVAKNITEFLTRYYRNEI